MFSNFIQAQAIGMGSMTNKSITIGYLQTMSTNEYS